METLDLSLVVLQIQATNPDAVAALRNSHNKDYLVVNEQPIAKALNRSVREKTPRVERKISQAVLRTDRHPRDLLGGWSFGRAEICDLIIGTQSQGIRDVNFKINYNWASLSLVLTNFSSHGTIIVDSATGSEETVTNSRAILENEQYRIIAGAIELMLQIPRRNEVIQMQYNANVQHMKRVVQQAIPFMSGLKIQSSGTITPAIVGRDRKFALREILGSGHQAVVHKAYDYATGDVFAAKKYKLKKRGSTKSMSTELGILTTLQHDHIIRYVSILKDPNPIIIMEFADGGSLETYEPADIRESAQILRDALEGMTFIHKEGIAHRDIKPGNILLAGRLWKLSDFGLSKKGEVMSTCLGTPMYLAPEVRNKDATYTDAVDVFGLGVVAIWITAGLSEVECELASLKKNGDEWYDLLDRRAEQSPIGLEVKDMIARSPADRGTAHQMLERFRVWHTIHTPDTAHDALRLIVLDRARNSGRTSRPIHELPKTKRARLRASDN